MNTHDTTEEWRAIPGTDGRYSVSSFGRVRSDWQGGAILAHSPDQKGYRIIRLSVPGSRPTFRVHRLVAMCFIGPRPDGMQINHKDGDKANNRPGNLEYVTGRDNIRHSWATGLHAADDRKGESHPGVKLTADDVRTIRAIYPAKTITELAAVYGVTAANISSIVKRKTWKHLV